MAQNSEVPSDSGLKRGKQIVPARGRCHENRASYLAMNPVSRPRLRSIRSWWRARMRSRALQPHEGEDLARRAAADRGVVLERDQARMRRSSRTTSQPMRRPARPEGLGDARQRHGVVVGLDRRRQPVALRRARAGGTSRRRRRDAVARRDLEDGPVVVGAGQRARGVVREVHDDQPGARPDELRPAVGVEAPAIGLVGLPATDFGVQRLGDRVERLVAGERAYHVIAVAHEAVDSDEDELLGGRHQHLVGLAALIESGDLAAQQRMALRLGVAESAAPPTARGRGRRRTPAARSAPGRRSRRRPAGRAPRTRTGRSSVRAERNRAASHPLSLSAIGPRNVQQP